jgi:uncharacterized protein
MLVYNPADSTAPGNVMTRLALFLLALFAGSVHAAASFPCAKASHATEKAICADPELAQLDEYLARYYRGAREALPAATDCLAADQRRWLTSARNVCKDGTCLKNAYLDRLAELDALQPGATRLKQLTLPVKSSLSWIVPAEIENAAKPRGTPKPLEVKGTLVNDAQGDGFLIRDASGQSHIVAMRLFIAPVDEDRLAILAKDRNATYVARGFAWTDEKRRVHFEPTRCTFIYRER